LGENQKDASTWPKVVTPRHYERLMSLIEDGKKAGEKLLLGGEGRAETQKIDFTVFTDVTWDSPLMQEEIFGPILPILEYEDLAAVCDAIDRRARPLGLYVFTESTETEETVLGTVVFGGGCVNDTISHIADISLPFGGVGESGMGCYHGRAGFDAFTHYKSVLKRSTLIDLPLRYRQDTQEKQDKVDALIRKVIH
jgi:aldehyde dehydrogenase (NAD+)